MKTSGEGVIRKLKEFKANLEANLARRCSSSQKNTSGQAPLPPHQEGNPNSLDRPAPVKRKREGGDSPPPERRRQLNVEERKNNRGGFAEGGTQPGDYIATPEETDRNDFRALFAEKTSELRGDQQNKSAPRIPQRPRELQIPPTSPSKPQLPPQPPLPPPPQLQLPPLSPLPQQPPPCEVDPLSPHQADTESDNSKNETEMIEADHFFLVKEGADRLTNVETEFNQCVKEKPCEVDDANQVEVSPQRDTPLVALDVDWVREFHTAYHELNIEATKLHRQLVIGRGQNKLSPQPIQAGRKPGRGRSKGESRGQR